MGDYYHGCGCGGDDLGGWGRGAGAWKRYTVGSAGSVVEEEEVVAVGWSRTTRGLKPRRPWWLEKVPPLTGGSEARWKLKVMEVGLEAAAMPPSAVQAACPWAIAIAGLPGDGNIGLSLSPFLVALCPSLCLCRVVVVLCRKSGEGLRNE